MTSDCSVSIPFLDLKAAYAELRGDIDAATARVYARAWYLLGPELAEFERAWAEYTAAVHAVGVANGLDALSLALRAVGVEAGDEVIVPSNTFIATWLAVTHIGAVPVAVEPDARTFNIHARDIARAWTPRTRAIVPVHLYGQPADMDPILEWAASEDVRVVVDAAQAHGALYRDRPLGALGDAVAWSFYPGKNLGAFGDAGAVTTSNGAVADRLVALRNYGSRQKYVHETKGFNSRLDEVQAAVLGAKLPHLPAWNQRRTRIAQLYDAVLPEGVRPHVPEYSTPSWHLYVVRTPRRDELKAYLADRGVETLIHYPTPPHRQGAYASDGLGPFPIADAIHREVLSLPIGPHLAIEDAELIASHLRTFFGVGS